MNHASVPLADDHFRDTLQRSELPVLVDFWAPWCSPFQVVAPALEELASEYAGKLVVAKVNTDKSQRNAAEYVKVHVAMSNSPPSGLGGAQSAEDPDD